MFFNTYSGFTAMATNEVQLDPTNGLTQSRLDAYFGRPPYKPPTLTDRKNQLIRSIRTYNYRAFLLDRVPIARVVYNYRPKEYLLRDVLAGISVGMTFIPQAMGYASVLGVPVVYGLYSIVFSSLIFSVFTTSIHASCTVAISGKRHDGYKYIDIQDVPKKRKTF